MQVIIQPRDGIEPFLEGIKQAEESVEIILYRLDRLEIEQELVVAVTDPSANSVGEVEAGDAAAARRAALRLSSRASDCIS